MKWTKIWSGPIGQQEETRKKKEKRRREHELKHSMLPPRLLADNYTSLSCKELGRSKLKASKISFPQEERACFSELENARFSPRCNSRKRSMKEVAREREGGKGLVGDYRKIAAAAPLIEHCNSTKRDLYSAFSLPDFQ